MPYAMHDDSIWLRYAHTSCSCLLESQLSTRTRAPQLVTANDRVGAGRLARRCCLVSANGHVRANVKRDCCSLYKLNSGMFREKHIHMRTHTHTHTHTHTLESHKHTNARVAVAHTHTHTHKLRGKDLLCSF